MRQYTSQNDPDSLDHPVLIPLIRQFFSEHKCMVDMNGVSLNKKCLSQAELGQTFFEWVKVKTLKPDTKLGPNEVGRLIYRYIRHKEGRCL